MEPTVTAVMREPTEHDHSSNGIIQTPRVIYILFYSILFYSRLCPSAAGDRLVGLVVKASASRAEDPGFESRLRRVFFGVESYQ